MIIKHPQELEESKTAFYEHQRHRSTKVEARSVERPGRAGYKKFLVTFCLFARPILKLARSSELVERHFSELLTVLLDFAL